MRRTQNFNKYGMGSEKKIKHTMKGGKEEETLL